MREGHRGRGEKMPIKGALMSRLPLRAQSLRGSFQKSRILQFGIVSPRGRGSEVRIHRFPSLTDEGLPLQNWVPQHSRQRQREPSESPRALGVGRCLNAL